MEEGGNRYQTINADHHTIGGSTAVLLVEHRRYGYCKLVYSIDTSVTHMNQPIICEGGVFFLQNRL